MKSVCNQASETSGDWRASEKSCVLHSPLGRAVAKIVCVFCSLGTRDATPKCNTQRALRLRKRERVPFDSDYSGEDDASPSLFSLGMEYPLVCSVYVLTCLYESNLSMT